MSKLFEETKINGMKLKNRFVRSATWEAMAAEDGTCTPGLIKVVTDLAEGGVGLIVTCAACVEKRGTAKHFELRIDDDQYIDGVRKMAAAVHQKGGTIVLQVNHAGLYADTALTGARPLVPSAMSDKEYQLWLKRAGFKFVASSPQEMTREDIEKMVEAFAHAAERSQKAGFDGIQVHAGHGYLMSEFLSTAYNKRPDEYGGSLENRARFLLETVQSMRKRVGRDYPILIKMNSRDFLDRGLELDESLQIGTMLKESGVDALEVSGGTNSSRSHENPVRTRIVSVEKEAYFRDEAAAFKKHVDLPIMLVGGIRSLQVAEEIVNNNIADYVSMSRPFIREPGLIKRWQSGDKSKATCLSDNLCGLEAERSGKLHCVVEKKIREKRENRTGERIS
ncbi:NADH:flavin oxidoreductase [Thermodesulfobacteriota bacterium]